MCKFFAHMKLAKWRWEHLIININNFSNTKEFAWKYCVTFHLATVNFGDFYLNMF